MGKYRPIGQILSLILISCCLSTCTKSDRKLLEGTWTRLWNDHLCTLSITDENTWMLEYTNQSEVDIRGSYTLDGNQITLMDEDGEYQSDSPGIYSITVSETSLVFSLINDPSESRRDALQGVWNKR